MSNSFNLPVNPRRPVPQMDFRDVDLRMAVHPGTAQVELHPTSRGEILLNAAPEENDVDDWNTLWANYSTVEHILRLTGPPAFIRQWGDDSCDFNDIRRRISLNCRQHQTIKGSSDEQRRRRLQQTQTQPESTSAAEQTVHSDISLTESQCSPPSPSSIGLNTNL